MPTKIELLKQAGFPDDEIGDWVTMERLRMQAAGHTDGEIDESLGITRPPNEVPPAFIERLKQGNWFSRIIGTAGEYGRNYFGDEPLGFSPENQRLLGKFGIVGDLAAAAGGPVDALLRSVPAGVGAVGAGLGQAYEEAHDAVLGPDPYAKGKAARDFAQLAQIAALLSGARGPKTGAVRTPALDVTNVPVIELPRAENFRNAAASISGTAASFQIEQKLLRLWTEHGIHPNEVAADALHDQSIGETMRSDSAELPQVYVGRGKARTVSDKREEPAAEPGQSDESRLPTGPRDSAKQASLQAQPDAVEANEPSASESASMGIDGRFVTNPSAPASASRIARSDDISQYDPPLLRRRPFIRDYRGEVRTDAQGRLLKDIEGRPLGAEFIAGRRFAGKADQSLSVKDMETASTKLNIPFAAIGPLAFEKGVGGMFISRDTRRTPGGYIFINNSMSLPDQGLTAAHELAHAIDHFAGTFSKNLTSDEIDELRGVYGTLRTSSTDASIRDPESFRYKPHEVNGELLAEGLRAYMANPNYFKTVAPKSAAKIRAAVNNNKYLKKVIQFNSLLAAGLVGAGVPEQEKDGQ